MVRLYSNENFPFPVVEFLRRLGHDVLTTLDADRAGQAFPDIDVLRFAILERRAVITLNRRDFVALHKRSNDHTGIIVCTFDLDYEAQARRIHVGISELAELDGQLLRINRPQE